MQENSAAHKTKLNIILIAVLVLVVLAIFGVSFWTNANKVAQTAVVKDANGQEYVLDLNESQTLTVATELGTNIIEVDGAAHTVRVQSADCPHQDCVNMGAISSAGQQIVCLPHRLTVDIADAEARPEYDVVS